MLCTLNNLIHEKYPCSANRKHYISVYYYYMDHSNKKYSVIFPTISLYLVKMQELIPVKYLIMNTHFFASEEV